MTMHPDLPLTLTHEVRDTCLCLHLQRAARMVARRFDNALRPLGLTNGQFSLLMSLNRPGAPRMKDLAPLLAMDRTTLTATLKPLERRGLVIVEADPSDRRSRRLSLTDAGRELLREAVGVWRKTHVQVDALLAPDNPEELRIQLRKLSEQERGIPA